VNRNTIQKTLIFDRSKTKSMSEFPQVYFQGAMYLDWADKVYVVVDMEKPMDEYLQAIVVDFTLNGKSYSRTWTPTTVWVQNPEREEFVGE
jgi:hypothetical protein